VVQATLRGCPGAALCLKLTVPSGFVLGAKAPTACAAWAETGGETGPPLSLAVLQGSTARFETLAGRSAMLGASVALVLECLDPSSRPLLVGAVCG
jgi:hypothetical protein